MKPIRPFGLGGNFFSLRKILAQISAEMSPPKPKILATSLERSRDGAKFSLLSSLPPSLSNPLFKMVFLKDCNNNYFRILPL